MSISSMFISLRMFLSKTCDGTQNIVYTVYKAYNQDWDAKHKEFTSKTKVA